MTYDDAIKALRAADAAGNAEDARRLAEIANRLKASPQPQDNNQNGFMGQVNAGIANTLGGLVDFVNPFDNEVWQDTPLGTGSAKDALTSGMSAIGANVATEEPQTVWQAAGRGTGEAAAAILPVVKGLQALTKAGGAVGAFADDAVRALSSWGGIATEPAAGALSRAAEQGAKEAGAPEWVQNTAAVLAPMSIPAGAAAVRPVARGALNLTEKLPLTGPLVGAARRMPGQVMSAVAPYTKTGGRQIAGERMVDLAGGRDRAEELAARTTGENPLNLTPAQMTGDQRMIALEQTARGEDAALDARLTERATASTLAAREQIGNMGGSVKDAQKFFEANRRRYVGELTRRADAAVRTATEGAQSINSTRLASENSGRVMAAVDTELANAKMRETELWSVIPKTVTVGTPETRVRAQEIVDNTSRYKRQDIPAEVFTYLDAPEEQSVDELYDLYSTLRETARNAMAGNNQQRNKARLANDLADAVLEDLGAKAGTSRIGRLINDARAFSRAMHETFDQGEVGRLLNRTIDGDTTTAPEVALSRTIDRGGPAAMVADRDMGRATNPSWRQEAVQEGVSGKSSAFVADYIKGAFNRRAFDAEGKFTSLGARSFLRDNEELLRRYPSLRDEIDRAVTDRVSADEFATRIQTRISALRDERRSAAERFLNAAPEDAFLAVLQDKNPVGAAARLANEARKDPSGQALAGLKGAVSDYLVANVFKVQGGSVSGNADKIQNILENPRTLAALKRIYSPAEMQRLESLARSMSRLEMSQRAQPSVGGLVEGRANRIVEYLARVVAARHAAQLGGGFAGGMQAAQMASSRTKEALGYLVSDRASQMLADAIEDPELYRALLTEVTAKTEKQILNRVWPYLVGTVTTGGADDQGDLPPVSLPKVNQQDILRQFGGE